VFAGGGAKGAYATAVLKALKSFVVQYDAVAGTSVGGLLALIFANNSIEIGEKIWGNLTYDTSYPLRSDKLKRLPKPIVKALALSFLVLNLIWARLHGFPTLYPTLNRIMAVGTLMTRITMAQRNAGRNGCQTRNAAGIRSILGLI
jgi:hypothetical protein